MQLFSSLNTLWHCLPLGLEWKLTFSSPVATAEFSKFAGILSVALSTASPFRIWNSSAEIPSPPLALFVVMLTKASLSLHDHLGRFYYLSLLFFGTLDSNGYIFLFLLLPLASLLFSAICKASLDNHFPFCISFYWGWSCSLPPVQCHEPLSIVLQALYQI